MLTIAADPKHLGARIGLTAVLHTWGSALTHHPHVHMIVPGGGLSPDGGAGSRPAPGFLLPVRVLAKLFRRLFLDRAHRPARGRTARLLRQPGRLAERRAFLRHLAPVRTKRWVVYAKPPFAGPEAVLAYLSRYTHRVAISNRRLGRARRGRRHLPLQGLSPRWSRALRHHDARRRRVHPPLPAPRPAEGLPPHPPLRPARQRRPAGPTSRASGTCSPSRRPANPPEPAPPPDRLTPCRCCGGRMRVIELFGHFRQPRVRRPPRSNRDESHVTRRTISTASCRDRHAAGRGSSCVCCGRCHLRALTSGHSLLIAVLIDPDGRPSSASAVTREAIQGQSLAAAPLPAIRPKSTNPHS